MKKIFTLAALVFAVAANAQVKWTLESDLSGVATEADKFTVSDATIGAGLQNDGIDKYKYKDGGVDTEYPWKSAKITPTNAQNPADDTHEKAWTGDQYRNINQASDDTQAMYMKFSAMTTAVEDVMTISSIEFDATRVGTDAVFVNARIIGNEGEYTSDWLISPANAGTVADGGAWVDKSGVGDAWASTNDTGFTPCRNDNSKGNTSAKCYTHFTIPAPSDLPEDLYEATVQIAIYGISNNKNAYMHGVTLNCSVPTAVQGVAEAKAEVAAPAKVVKNGQIFIGNYTVAGAQVK